MVIGVVGEVVGVVVVVVEVVLMLVLDLACVPHDLTFTVFNFLLL
jgi:hypothetical protein